MTTYRPKKVERNHRIVTPVPLPAKPQPPDLEDSAGLGERLRQRFLQALNGFWKCDDCNAPCEIQESDHGQPNCCAACGSYRIHFVPPLHQLQPEAA